MKYAIILKKIGIRTEVREWKAKLFIENVSYQIFFLLWRGCFSWMALQFDVFDCTGLRLERDIWRSEKLGTTKPTDFLQRFRRNSSGTCVSGIVMRCNMKPLIDTCPFKNLPDTVCNNYWLLIQWVQPLEDCAIRPYKRVLNFSFCLVLLSIGLRANCL